MLKQASNVQHTEHILAIYQLFPCDSDDKKLSKNTWDDNDLKPFSFVAGLVEGMMSSFSQYEWTRWIKEEDGTRQVKAPNFTNIFYVESFHRGVPDFRPLEAPWVTNRPIEK